MARSYPVVRAMEDHGAELHVGLTEKVCFCGLVLVETTGDWTSADEPAEGLCQRCVTALDAHRSLTRRDVETAELHWNPDLVPNGHLLANAVQAALDGRRALELQRRRLWDAPERHRDGIILRFLDEVTEAQKILGEISDQAVVALRDVCRPAPSWERIGKALGVTATPVRHRYQRAVQAMPPRPEACNIGGEGCGQIRHITAGQQHDAWKNHDLDHEAHPQLPQNT
ncbi:hypothetical protein AB0H73_10210 [Streptomyces olivoreticuli]